MASTSIEIGDDLSALLGQLGNPIAETAREMIVLELYRRSLVSSGKAAALLGMARLDFIRRASELKAPYFNFDEEEWQAGFILDVFILPAVVREVAPTLPTLP